MLGWFSAEAFQGLRILRDIARKEFQGDKTAERRILGLIDNAHSATAEFFDDAIVRYRVANQWIGAGHARHMLRRARSRVNEGEHLRASFVTT